MITLLCNIYPTVGGKGHPEELCALSCEWRRLNGSRGAQGAQYSAPTSLISNPSEGHSNSCYQEIWTTHIISYQFYKHHLTNQPNVDYPIFENIITDQTSAISMCAVEMHVMKTRTNGFPNLRKLIKSA